MAETLAASQSRDDRPGDGRPEDGRPGQQGRAPTHFAALDLGTNNCRLLIAQPTQRGFRIVDAYSRIVRLGEGLSQSGRLSEAAMERAYAALRVCADKVQRRQPVRLRAIATQACRTAANGAEFLAEVEARTGISLRIISPREEARLSVAGCSNLIDREADAALVLDVGGGSTELAWLDLRQRRGDARGAPPIAAWLSIPIGVVTLAERFPEEGGQGRAATAAWFGQMVEAVRAPIAAFAGAAALRELFNAGSSHLIGTSGAITSLAGLHLELPRYDRSKVDGLWMTRSECEAVRARLAALTTDERARQPCIGPDRADLVLAGAAILEAVQAVWPCERVRVADRGLREGVLMSLMSERRRRPPPSAQVMADDPPRKRMVRLPVGGEGRSTAQRLKTAKQRTPSSQAWLERQLNDPYVAEAKAKGYRSRAAFKLIELDDKLRLIRRGAAVIDLGSAPGGWIQVLLARGAGTVAGVDLLPIDPMGGAELIEGDFTDPAVADRLAALVGGPADLIISDMAPNTTGHRQTDHLRIIGLIEAAAAFAERMLKPGGAFVTKAFQGGETAAVIAALKHSFESVRTVKPKASRAESSEVYLVATGFRGADR